MGGNQYRKNPGKGWRSRSCRMPQPITLRKSRWATVPLLTLTPVWSCGGRRQPQKHLQPWNTIKHPPRALAPGVGGPTLPPLQRRITTLGPELMVAERPCDSLLLLCNAQTSRPLSLLTRSDKWAIRAMINIQPHRCCLRAVLSNAGLTG